MRALPLLLFAAVLVGGCATRLPVECGEPTELGKTSRRPTLVSASIEQAADPFGHTRPANGSFLRCGLEQDLERCESEEERKRHEPALSLGYTFERGEGGFTIGVDYTYWVTERFGVGPFFDFVAGDIEAYATGAGIWFRPLRCVEHLSLQVALGVDISPEEEEGHGRTWEVAPLIRLGVTHVWDVGRGFRLGPAFIWDGIYPDKQAYSFVLALAKEF